MKVPIYIPTAGRPDKVVTLEQIPKSWRDHVHLVVPDKEYSAYKKHNKKWNIVCTPKSMPERIAVKRDWIADHATSKYVWMMDDDLTYFIRDEEGRYKRCRRSDMGVMYKEVVGLLEKGFAMVGIAQRTFSMSVQDKYAVGSRCTSSWAINNRIRKQNDLRWKPEGQEGDFLMSDLYMIICLLALGELNAVLYSFTHEQKWKVDSPGGCSRYRNRSNYAESSRWIASQFPGYVKLVQRKMNRGWDSFRDNKGQAERLDIQVSWKKLLKAAQRKKCDGIRSFLGG